MAGATWPAKRSHQVRGQITHREKKKKLGRARLCRRAVRSSRQRGGPLQSQRHWKKKQAERIGSFLGEEGEKLRRGGMGRLSADALRETDGEERGERRRDFRVQSGMPRAKLPTPLESKKGTTGEAAYQLGCSLNPQNTSKQGGSSSRGTVRLGTTITRKGKKQTE